jgi:hypothetical protein
MLPLEQKPRLTLRALRYITPTPKAFFILAVKSKE